MCDSATWTNATFPVERRDLEGNDISGTLPPKWSACPLLEQLYAHASVDQM
jgi:hypothetical protein